MAGQGDGTEHPLGLPHPPDEYHLLQAVARREPAAIERFFRAYSNGVMRYAYRRVGEQHEDAEEITLDTFKAALELAHTFDGSCRVSTWLIAICRLKIADHWRRSRSTRRIPQLLLRSLDDPLISTSIRWDQHGPEAAFIRDEFIDEALGSLNDDERDVLMLRYVEQLSVKDIAQIMGRSEKATESLLSRARAKPRQRLMKLERRRRTS